MSGEKGVNPGPAREIIPRDKNLFDLNSIVQEIEEVSSSVVENSILDQIIIAPEIMNLILKKLDFQSLKSVRLVCKSWLLEAQPHMERRGEVKLDNWMVEEFIETYHSKIRALPQPFRLTDLTLYTLPQHSTQVLVCQLSSLCPPLQITRLVPVDISLNLSFFLIIQSSPSLEYLHLLAENCEAGFLPPMDPKQIFPKLRHIEIDTRTSADETNMMMMRRRTTRSHFPSIVAWLVESSPVLDNFETWRSNPLSRTKEKLASEVLMKVNIQNVKSLTTCHTYLRTRVLDHFLSISFSRLESLNMCLHYFGRLLLGRDVLVATVSKCTNTLRVLNISAVSVDLEDFVECPVLPYLRELTLTSFPYSTNFLSERFPSLQVLNVGRVEVHVLGDFWRELSPLLGLRTLRVKELRFAGDDYDPEEQPIRFFEKFPSLERVQLNSLFLLHCCGLKAGVSDLFSGILGGVKHLELRGNEFKGWNPGFSSLAVLKGLESVSMVSAENFDILFLPYKELPNLKMIQFPWKKGPCTILDKLLGIARGVERVVITNCCWAKLTDGPSKECLKIFFESAPNAVCGCKAWEKTSEW